MTSLFVKIRDVCTVVSGSTPKSNVPAYWDGSIKWITPAEIDNQTYFVFDSERHISDRAVKDTGLRQFPAGTVILSSRAPIGKTAIAGCPMYCNQGFKNLICGDQIHNKYLYFFLSGKTQYLNSLGRGATFKEISKEIVENILIPLPEMETQIAIAEQFEHIEMLIRQRSEQLSQLDLFIKSRFVELFGDPVVNPMGWQIKPLLDMGYCKNGMNFHIGDYGIEIHCLGVGDFKNLSIIDRTDKLSLVSLNEEPSAEYLLQNDDIVFVRSNGNKELVGRCLAVYPNDVPTTYSGFCIRYRRTCTDVTTQYLLRVLKAESVRKQMAGRGANIQNLNQQILAALVIPIPPMELQEQFASFVAQVDKSKYHSRKSVLYAS